MISLACVDMDIPFEEDEKRTLLHRQILAEYGLSDANTFPWEALKDIYDPRSNSSTIVFCINKIVVSSITKICLKCLSVIAGRWR